MKSWKKRQLVPAITVVAICGVMGLAFQNCAKAKFSIDPVAKSEALGKEGVFDNTGGNDPSVAGNVPGNDPSVSGGTTSSGNDNSIPGKNAGNDNSIPGSSSSSNDNNVPGKNSGNDNSLPGKNPSNPFNLPSNLPGKIPGNDNSIPGAASVVGTSVPVSFIFECSNMRSSKAGGNILTASALKVVIVDKNNKIACELSGDFKSQILNTKKISFTPCSGLAAGSYDAHVMDASVPSSQFLTKQFTQADIRFTINANGSIQSSNPSVAILYDLNNQNSAYVATNLEFGGTSTANTQKSCDKRASPLIISMNSDSKGIKLSAPLDGIQFDILGANSSPQPYDKKQISWLVKEDQEYYFIVLPNKQGQVLGIDEMFGDNTKGPDGKFAANGYAALAKYDDNKDGYITEEDAIFSELRLWKDSNRDGIADPNELYTLKEKGITVIDLHYDSRYKETDQYGNQTLMKSVTKTEDGKLHLLFDLWFRPLNITK